MARVRLSTFVMKLRHTAARAMRRGRRDRARDDGLERAWCAVEAFAAACRARTAAATMDDDADDGAVDGCCATAAVVDDDDDDDTAATAFDARAIFQAFTQLQSEDDPRVLLVETAGVFLDAADAMRRASTLSDDDDDSPRVRAMTHACVMFIRAERAWGERRVFGARVKSARAEQLEYEGVLRRWLAWALEECERLDLQSYVLENSARNDELLGCVIHALFVDVNADDGEKDGTKDVAASQTRAFRANAVGVAYLEEKLLTQSTHSSPEPLMREVFLRGFNAHTWLVFITRAFDRVRTLAYEDAFTRAESYSVDVVSIERAKARRGAVLAMYLSWLKDASCRDGDGADADDELVIDALAFIRECLATLKRHAEEDDYSFASNVADAACNTAYVLVNRMRVRRTPWDVRGLLESVRGVVDAVRAVELERSDEDAFSLACVELASDNLCRVLLQRVEE
jgi:hypothetical protein